MEAIGILYLAILFTACFVFVAMVKLALLGLRSIKNKPESKPEEPKKEEPPQPVYYIVEKKRSRSRANYGTPREIKFKEDK